MFMFILWTLILITLFMASWVLWLRPWLECKPGAQWFFKLIEPVEIYLWSKSETVLWARFKQLMGFVSGGLALLGGLDPMAVLFIVPEEYRWLLLTVPPAAIWLDGWITKKLRETTTKPLEMVAVRSDASPEVKEVVKEAAAVNKDAVETIAVADAKAAS